MVSRRCVREVRESRVYLGCRLAVTAHAPRLVTGFFWVSASDSSAPQALRNRKKIARSAALLHICRLRWCVRKSRILRLLCEGERNGKLKMGKIRLGLIGFAEEAVGGDYGDGGGVVAGSKAEVEALAEEHLRKGGFATEAVDDPWLGGA